MMLVCMQQCNLATHYYCGCLPSPCSLHSTTAVVSSTSCEQPGAVTYTMSPNSHQHSRFRPSCHKQSPQVRMVPVHSRCANSHTVVVHLPLPLAGVSCCGGTIAMRPITINVGDSTGAALLQHAIMRHSRSLLLVCS